MRTSFPGRVLGLCLAALLIIPSLVTRAAGPGKLKAVRIPVPGTVDGVMLKTLERRIQLATEEGAEILFFEIDTYGGRVDSAEKIAILIESTPSVTKVAYIPTRAISAGTLIAMACDEIVMRPSALMGDCKPIINTIQGPQSVDEKFESVFRKNMVGYAQRRGYPVALTEAMVSEDREILRIPGAEGLEHEFVKRRDLESWSEGRLRKLGIVDQPDLSADRGGNRRFTVIVDGQEEEIPVVVLEGDLLTLSGNDALEYGFARFVAKDLEELLSLYQLSAGEVRTLPVLWWEHFVKLLNTMPVQALLVALGLLGFFLEFKAPGFGLPGVLGLACFGLLFFATHLAGLAQWIEIIMFGLGIVLIVLEIVVIPGFGFAGISGILLVVSSLVLALVSFSPGRIPVPGTVWPELGEALTTVFVGIGAFVVAMFILVRYLPQTPVLGRIMHVTSMRAEEGYTVQVKVEEALIGQSGISRTVLRPAGKIEVDGVTYDAATRGDFIGRGETVKVVDTSGNRIIVKRV